MTDTPRGWTKKFKGNKVRGGAWIYTHPNAFEGRAIVQNEYGITFNGVRYETIHEAAEAATEFSQ